MDDLVWIGGKNLNECFGDFSYNKMFTFLILRGGIHRIDSVV